MISANAKYWIWLSLALGWNTPKIKKILESYHDVTAFYNAGEHEWRLCGFLHSDDINHLNTVPLTKADEVLDRCRQLKYSVLETCNMNLGDSYIDEREKYWKDVLMSRKFGLNDN